MKSENETDPPNAESETPAVSEDNRRQYRAAMCEAFGLAPGSLDPEAMAARDAELLPFQPACCSATGARFNTDMPHEHVVFPDGVERLVWADGKETDLHGYRSGARDSASGIQRLFREVMGPLLAREEFARLLDRANAPGSNARS